MNVRFIRRSAVATLAALVSMGTAVARSETSVAATAPGDSAAAARPVLDLAQCVDIALRSSLGLATARAERDAAAAGVQGAWGAFLPSVSLSRQYSKNERTDFDVASTGVIPDSIATLGGRIIPYNLGYPTGELYDQSIKTTYSDWGADAALNVFDGLRKYGALKSARQHAARGRVVGRVRAAAGRGERGRGLLQPPALRAPAGGRRGEPGPGGPRAGADGGLLQTRQRGPQRRLAGQGPARTDPSRGGAGPERRGAGVRQSGLRHEPPAGRTVRDRAFGDVLRLHPGRPRCLVRRGADAPAGSAGPGAGSRGAPR